MCVTVFLGQAIVSGFISKGINDFTDITISKIIKADRNRKDKSIQSRVYQVIIDVLNDMTFDKYKGQDKIYEVAASLLKGFRDEVEKDISEIIRLSLREIIQDVDLDLCNSFIELLYHEISKNENADLYREVLLNLLKQEFKNDQGKLNQIREELNRVTSLLESMNKCSITTELTDKKYQKNKKQNYINNWNSKLFLHLDSDKPVTLADAFIMPDYKKVNVNKRIGFMFDNTLDKVISKFVNYDRTSTMLISGDPGIGKSSIVSWIASTYETDNRFIVLRFRDWDYEELQEGLLKTICTTLNCKRVDLECKILVMDGFDELKALNIRDRLLTEFFADILDYKNTKCIITSRPNYINFTDFQNAFILLPFGIKKIKKFYNKITNNVLDKKNIDYENLQVLGIPAILYMSIMSNIDITKGATRAELYRRIFARKGGVFDRFSYEGVGYDEGANAFRNRSNIEDYLKFLQETAFAMFEKNSLVLHRGEWSVPELEFQGNLISVLEFPIKHFFESTETNIEFIHKSIYEYFVSEYMFLLLENEMVTESVNKRRLANILGKLFKRNYLSLEICNFLRSKIKGSNLKKKYEVVNSTFNLMLRNGMNYYVEGDNRNPVDCEMRIFNNMLSLLHLWDCKSMTFDNSFCKYLYYYDKFASLNLSFVNMSELDLSYAVLRKSKLVMADLRKADLQEADLKEADLQEADLRGANLRGAVLKRANLSGAKMQGIKLIGVDLAGVDLEGKCLAEADLRRAILIEAKLKNIDLAGADLARGELVRADLKGADLRGANLTRVDLREADLREAKLIKADLTEANLREANLREADLAGVDLTGVDLREANLTGVNLTGANLTRARLSGTRIVGANLTKAILFGVDLMGAFLSEVNIHHTIFDEDQIAYLYSVLRIDAELLEDALIYDMKTKEMLTFRELFLRN